MTFAGSVLCGNFSQTDTMNQAKRTQSFAQCLGRESREFDWVDILI